MSLPPANNPDIDAAAERVRAVVQRQPGHCTAVVADALGVSRADFRRLVEDRERAVEASFLIDVITALVYEAGIDPQWLLTGEYDAAMHRQALLIGEDRSAHGVRALRAFVLEQYRQLQSRAMFFGLFTSKLMKSRDVRRSMKTR